MALSGLSGTVLAGLSVRLFGRAYTRWQVATFVLSAFVLGFVIASIGVLVVDYTTGSIPEQHELFSPDPTGSIHPT